MIMSWQHPLANRKSVSLSELAKDRFFINNFCHDLRMIYTELCQEVGFNPQVFFVGDQPRLTAKLLANNYAVSLIPQFIYRKGQSFGDNPASKTRLGLIRAIPITEPEGTISLGIAKLKDRYMSKATSAFYEYLREEIPKL